MPSPPSLSKHTTQYTNFFNLHTSFRQVNKQEKKKKKKKEPRERERERERERRNGFHFSSFNGHATNLLQPEPEEGGA